MTRTVIHLVRHGAVANPAGIVYGTLPGYHLSATGRSMAAALGSYFHPQDVHVVLASPLERAQETGAEIARQCGVAVRTDGRLIEAANRFEGVAFGPAHLIRHPARLRHLANPLLPTWGERYRDQADRMNDVVLDARSSYEGSVAVLVSHQSPIWSLRCRLVGRPAWGLPGRRDCALASVTTLTYSSHRLVSVRYSEPARFA